jgi:hypothetical protein
MMLTLHVAAMAMMQFAVGIAALRKTTLLIAYAADGTTLHVRTISTSRDFKKN